MNYQQQLPFDPNRCTSQPSQFNNPPFVPNNLDTAPELLNVVPIAATMVANEASASCNKNAGRMFLFNQLSNNGYANIEFVQAVQTVMDMLLVGLFRGNYNNPNQGLPDAVNKAMIMCNAANFQKFPELQNYVDNNLFNDAVKIVNSFPGIKSDLMQVKQQMSQQNQQQNFYNNNNNNNNNVFQRNPQNVYDPSRMQSGAHINQTPSVFSSTNQPQQGSPLKQNIIGQEGRYDSLRINANPQTNNINNNNITQPVVNQGSYFSRPNQTSVITEVIPDKKLVWSPSPAQWHPITCDIRIQKIILKEVKWADDKIYVVSIAVNLSEEEMEEAKHKIGYIDRVMTSTTPEKYESRKQGIIDNIDSFVEKNQEMRAAEDFSLTNTTRTAIFNNFLAPAIFEGRVIMKKELQHTENDLSAFAIKAIISTPVLVDNTQEKLLDQLYDCNSFLRIQTLLKSSLKSNVISSVSKELVYRIDKLFTREVNSILRNRLSLDVSIDSFIEDIMVIPTYLKENNYGDVVIDAYLSCQEDFTKTYLNQDVANNEVQLTMISDLKLEVENKVEGGQYEVGDLIPVAFMTQFHTFTYLQVNSTDLSINEFDNKLATEVIESKNPELYKLAKETFDEEENVLVPVAHRLLITRDNVIYEFHRGLFNKDFFTISRFH